MDISVSPELHELMLFFLFHAFRFLRLKCSDVIFFSGLNVIPPGTLDNSLSDLRAICW